MSHTCDERRLELAEIEAIGVATYIKQFGTKASNRTVKQHLAAIRQLFDYLSTKVASWRSNPAASRGTYRVIIRHGVSRVRSGQRQTLGIIRDAR